MSVSRTPNRNNELLRREAIERVERDRLHRWAIYSVAIIGLLVPALAWVKS